MGVCECNRYTCDSICCNKWLPNFGYICDTCKSEFINKLQEAGRLESTEKYFTKKLKQFMASEPGTFTVKQKKQKPVKISINEFLNEWP